MHSCGKLISVNLLHHKANCFSGGDMHVSYNVTKSFIVSKLYLTARHNFVLDLVAERSYRRFKMMKRGF